MERDETVQPFLVWGLGRTGKATARYLSRQGLPFDMVDSREAAALGDEVKGWVEQGSGSYFSGALPCDLSAYKAVLVSPGVPYDHPSLVEARSRRVPTLASMAWAAQQCSAPIVAVTGSAGKSTTVTLIGEMLRRSGLETFVGGNLGTPLVSLLDSGNKVDRIVLECSSFQLEATPSLDAHVAVLTNLQPNHLDRHETMERYAECKSRLFSSLPKDRWVVLRDHDPASCAVVGESAAQRLWVHGGNDRTSWIAGDASKLTLQRPGQVEETYDLNLFRLPGHHNRENLALAIAAARIAGATPAGIRETIRGFEGLPHRLQEVGRFKGVLFFNDSKATTPDSTSKAVKALQEQGRGLRLLLGGYPKGGGFASLEKVLKECVAKSYFFGQASQQLMRDLPALPSSVHATMEEAFAAAVADAAPGETVLLSPACASFDEFKNFEERGHRFQEWVQELHSCV